MSTVLIVDDERKITRLLSERIAAEGYRALVCASAEEALPLIERGGIDIVLCDLRLGGMDGIELLRRARAVAPGTDFVVMTAYASAATAVEALRLGAYEYLIKPFQMDEVVMLLRRIDERRELMLENTALREQVSRPARGDIVGDSTATRALIEVIAKVAPTDVPVLIQGESGTGKELVAAEIHRRGGRARKPFIVINCAAVPETLLEAELFGYEKGAFTGAAHRKPGQFMLADDGSLFLDEIGDMPLSLQAKLLRAIETGGFLPLGAAKAVTVDARIIAATNRNLEELTARGQFREDLFFRLNVFPIRIAPLRERAEDIVPIARAFLSERGYRGAVGDDALETLRGYHWPGNVRELRNVLERAMILAGGGPLLPAHMLTPAAAGAPACDDVLAGLVGRRSLEEIERKMIELALAGAGGNRSRAAGMLGITRRTLYSRMERYGVGGSRPDESG